MRTQSEPINSFATGFGTLSSKIIREYANGMADGFLNDLAAATESNRLAFVIDSENALIDAFRKYASGESLFKN